MAACNGAKTLDAPHPAILLNTVASLVLGCTGILTPAAACSHDVCLHGTDQVLPDCIASESQPILCSKHEPQGTGLQVKKTFFFCLSAAFAASELVWQYAATMLCMPRCAAISVLDTKGC